jgi:hypothetical protein
MAKRRARKRNVDRYTLGMAAPGIERAASLSSVRRRRLYRGKRKDKARSPRRRNPATMTASEVVKFWRTFAKRNRIGVQAINRGIKEIRSDPEYWEGENLWKLVDRVGSNPNGGPRKNDPVAGLERALRGTKLKTRERRSALVEYLRSLPKALADAAYHGGIEIGIVRESDRLDLASRRKLHGNPPELEPVIGRHVLALEYKGGKGKKKKSLWRHDFSHAGAKVIGLKDGSVLIKRGKRPLWRYFE